MDETHIRIKGQWKYGYRAVDKAGQTVDFLLTAHRDQKAALRFPKKAFRQHGRPVKVTIDPSETNTAALAAPNTDINTHTVPKIEIRQRQYLNNLIEQDHRAIKPITRLIRARIQQLGQHQFFPSGQPPPVTWVSDLLSTPHIARLPYGRGGFHRAIRSSVLRSATKACKVSSRVSQAHINRAPPTPMNV